MTTQTVIYAQHDAAFASVEAFVIAHKGERVATIAFKFPRDGAGRLYAYVHWLGTEMVRGFASGGGYDKRSAAAAGAAQKMNAATGVPSARQEEIDLYRALVTALAKDGGATWDRELRDAGFDVWQAV